jgi:integrase
MKEAQAALSTLQVEKEAGTFIDPTRMTLGEYLDQWWANAEAHGWSGNTKREYGVSLRLHLKPYLGKVRLQALTGMQVEAHYSFLLKEGKVRRNKKGEVTYRGPLSRKTVLNVHIAFRSALNDAVAADPPLLRKNVVLNRFKYSRRKDRPEMLTWTVEELRAFLAFTAGDGDRVLWWVALMTGMRRGELLGLRRRDLLLARAQLNVRQQYARDGDEGLCLRSLKTGSAAWRTIDLDDETVTLLQPHLEAQEFSRRSWGKAYVSKCPRCGKQVDRRCAACRLAAADLDLVFCHPDGSPYDPDVITHRFERRAVVCADVLNIRLHDCRHTHATLLLEGGATERYVAERLGDTVEMIHETYGHVTTKMRTSAVLRLAALIAGDPAAELAVRDPAVTNPDREALKNG